MISPINQTLSYLLCCPTVDPRTEALRTAICIMYTLLMGFGKRSVSLGVQVRHLQRAEFHTGKHQAFQP